VPVRLYRPSAEENLPLLVFFHGGGWVIGNLDTHDDASLPL
jgi:acetyl esterase